MFTQEQLKSIRLAAKKVKNQGELMVYEYIRGRSLGVFTEQQLNIIKYCAEECKRQRSGEMSVYDMVNAWNWAEHSNRDPKVTITIGWIEELGKIVEPDDNRNGFRRIPIGVSDGFTFIEKANWERVPALLEMLIDGYYNGDSTMMFHQLSKTSEDQFYYEYENIHPFRDGNGRTGKILYNYLNGTLDNPIMPPNFWNISNP